MRHLLIILSLFTFYFSQEHFLYFGELSEYNESGELVVEVWLDSSDNDFIQVMIEVTGMFLIDIINVNPIFTSGSFNDDMLLYWSPGDCIEPGVYKLFDLVFLMTDSEGCMNPFEGDPSPVVSCDGEFMPTIIDECIQFDGCTDQYAINYDEEAIIDDGTCEYPETGDLNNDTIFNISDIIMMINYVLNNEYVFYADLNEDDFLNVLDVLILVNWILE